METKKLESLAIDSVWYLLNEQIDFFVRKTNVVSNVFNECIELANVSSFNKDNVKEYFIDYVCSPFKTANLGIQMATRFNNEDSYTIFEDGRLNLRGLARTRICMGMINKVETVFDDIDAHFKVASIVKDFNYNDSRHNKKSMFEIMCDFISNRPNLHNGNEKMIANAFIECIEYKEVVNALDTIFNAYLASLIKEFALSPQMQREKNFYREVPYKIAKEVTLRFDRRDFYASNRIIASDLARNILRDYNN